MRGRTDRGLITQINKEFVSFIVAVLNFYLGAWKSGTYIDPGQFRARGPKGIPRNPGAQRR